MANLLDHLNQAKHNETLANTFAEDDNCKYWDWLITISFYAAIHYVEAFFFTTTLGHTESACPPNLSNHSFRVNKIQEFMKRDVWVSYRKLQNASNNVRYLASAGANPGKIAIDYYTFDNAKKFLRNDLKQVSDAVMTELKK